MWSIIRLQNLKGKILLSLLVFLTALEVGSRCLFGNYAQSALVERVEDPDLCMVLGKNRDLIYTGWYQKVSPTRMESDRFGSRGFVKVNKNQKDSVKIFMVGDSFTYGQGVNIEDSLPHLVNQGLGERYQVWNFGVPGRNFYQLAADIERLLVYKPDLILVNTFINDFHEPPGQCMLSETTDWQMPLMRNCHLCRWTLLLLSPEAPHLTPDEIENAVVDQIGQIERLGRENDVRIVFVPLMDRQVYRTFEPTLPPVYALIEKHAKLWLDLEYTWSTLLLRTSEYQIAGEFHWNAEGNRLLAQAYVQALEDKKHQIFQRVHPAQHHKHRPRQ